MTPSAPKHSWKAVKSCGIVLIREKNHRKEYLMVCRRNTFAFADYIIGKYKDGDLKYIIQLVLYMTFGERKSIRTETFESCWNKMYVNTKKADGVFFETSRQKFMRNKHIFDSIDDKVPCLWKYPEWGFAKGHMNARETSLECAKRELFEETRISDDMYTIDTNIPPFEEEFMGTDGHKYINLFFIAIANNECEPFLDVKNAHQIREIRNILWFSYTKAIQNIRNYENSKLFLLKEINGLF